MLLYMRACVRGGACALVAATADDWLVAGLGEPSLAISEAQYA